MTYGGRPFDPAGEQQREQTGGQADQHAPQRHLLALEHRVPEPAEPVDVGVAEEHAVADETVTNAPTIATAIVAPHAPSNSDEPEAWRAISQTTSSTPSTTVRIPSPCANQIVPAPRPRRGVNVQVNGAIVARKRSTSRLWLPSKRTCSVNHELPNTTMAASGTRAAAIPARAGGDGLPIAATLLCTARAA